MLEENIVAFLFDVDANSYVSRNEVIKLRLFEIVVQFSLGGGWGFSYEPRDLLHLKSSAHAAQALVEV